MLEILINSSVALTLSVIVVLAVKTIFKKWMTPEWHVSVWLTLVPFMALMLVPTIEFETQFSVREMFPHAEKVTYIVAGEKPGETQGAGDAGGTYEKTDTQPGGGKTDGAGTQTEGGNAIGEGYIFIDGQLQEEGDVNGLLEIVPDGQETEYFKKPAAYVTLGANVIEISRTAEIVILSVWATGVIVLSGVEIARYIRLRKSLSGLPDCDDPEILALYEACQNCLNLRKAPKLKTGAEASMLVGILSKTIYIKEGATKEELKYVLMHELCHYKLRDVINNLAATVGLALSWFNPVIHLAFRTFRRDIEVCCDSEAIRMTGERREYAEVLVRAAAGQKGFVLASTSFLGGEKEVVERVKRIAGAKKRRIIFETLGTAVIVFSLIACTSVPAPGDMVGVKVGEYWQMDVPEKWLGDMRTVRNVDYDALIEASGDPAYREGNEGSGRYLSDDVFPDGSKLFLDKNGVEFAISYMPHDVDFTNDEILFLMGGVATPHGGYVPGTEMTDTEICDRIFEAVSEDFSQKGFTDITLKDFSVNESGNRHIMIGAKRGQVDVIGLGEDGSGTKNIPEATYNIAVQENGSNIVVVAADEKYANELELIEMLMSARRLRSEESDVGGVQLSGIEPFDNHPDDRTLTKEEYEKYVKQSLRSALEWYILGDKPVEEALSGYGIEKIEEILEVEELEAGQRPMGQNGWFYDTAIWDIIYPHARAYKVTYDLTPENEEYYEGKTHFERVAVFAVNDYVSPIYDGEGGIPEPNVPGGNFFIPADFYFLGFVDEESAAFHGCDQVILEMLNDWYGTLNPMSDEYYRTDYIGDAQKVAKIVKSLPLHEYIDMSEGTFSDNSIVIQTAEEPYGLTVNYTFNTKLTNVSDEIALTPLTKREEGILNAPINAYVTNQLWQNINQLYSRIGNVGEITVNVYYIDEEYDTLNLYTIHTSRDYFYNM